MRCRDTSRMVGVFVAQLALIALLCVFDRYFSLKTLGTLAIVALVLPIVGYFTIFIRPSVYESWCKIFREMGRSIISCVVTIPVFFSVKTFLRVYHLVATMKIFSNSADEWFALMLFPFKVYVVAGIPMIWFCFWLRRVTGVRFSGMDSRALGENVAVFYIPFLGILLFGALIQAIFSNRGQSSRTIFIFVAGFALLCIAFFHAGH